MPANALPYYIPYGESLKLRTRMKLQLAPHTLDRAVERKA
jgi:hypothetical protein